MDSFRNGPRATRTRDSRRRAWLVRIRLKRRMTQAQVAQGAGISTRAYGDIERGVENGKQRTRRAIAKAMQFPMELWGKTPARNKSRGPQGLTPILGESPRRWLAEIRLERRMTQKEAAAASWLSEPGYWKIESGDTRNPPQETKAAIARALGFPESRWEAEEHGKARPKSH